MTYLPRTHGIEKLPGSFCFLANLFSAIALHSKGLGSSSLRLFAKMSFRNLAYDGIWVMALVKGISMLFFYHFHELLVLGVLFSLFKSLRIWNLWYIWWRWYICLILLVVIHCLLIFNILLSLFFKIYGFLFSFF